MLQAEEMSVTVSCLSWTLWAEWPFPMLYCSAITMAFHE